MNRKNYLTLFLTAFLFLAAGSVAFAQTGPVRGEVKLKKADGTTVPVADAIVEAYRMDIDKGKLPEAKTNKRGEFNFVGAQLGARYVLSISGPGIQPVLEPNVKANTENLVIDVSEGDGRRPSEAEVRNSLKNISANPTGELTAEQKKQQAENEKKIAEVNEANKKAENSNKIINAAVKAGAEAYNASNYDLAIAEWQKGIDAAPDFIGSAPTFHGNKGLAHQKRAIGVYNASLKGDTAAKVAALEKMKPDFAAAFESFNRGLEILKTASPSDATEQKNAAVNKATLLRYAVETHGLAAMLLPDPVRDAQAPAIVEQYLVAETDTNLRTTTLLSYANNMNGAGQLQSAAAAFRKVLEVSPDNLDAIAGLGLALYSIGYDPPNKDVLQEGLNYMQKFVDAAPDTHKLKQSVRDTIEELKNTQKLTPQKTTPPKRKG